ncbi:M48 family metalloprotease [Comamonas antarctica]|uniref:M48 family metalloprotease n=1 Tax=Comamonas antarctica TaxID=2743470 RepID=A0A6N1X173_9BURK|nr:M48 family metalloprotease [Comamonas antarctica]QKV51485.1 M48 family metalloprotease [Comamonas antarctica]
MPSFPQHPRRLLAALALAGAGWLPLSASAQLQLPTLGDGASITTSDERRMGDRIIRSLYRDPDYLEDGPLQEYVEGIWKPLLAAARARGELSPELDERFAWQILLGRDRSINAFALPGGYFGVHLGLIGVVGTRDELASVLAHELSHVSQRHIARMIAQQSRQSPLVIGSMILGALAAAKSPGAGQALMIGGQALTAQNQLNFSRDMEREADRMGYGLMAPAGFAPQGAIGMFDRLQQANRLNDNGSWPYLRSHPLTSERIADMQSRLPAGQRAAQPAPSLEHAMMAARARVLSRPGVDVLRQWTRLPESSGFDETPQGQRVAGLYAAVLAHMQLQDWGPARAGLPALTQALAGDAAGLRQAALLAAELELAAGQPQAALDALAPAMQADDKADKPTRPVLLLRTQILLRLGQAQAMAQPLQTWVTLYPRDAAAWQTLAQLWQAQNQPLRALRAEGEAQAAHYDYSAAVDRFRAGQELARRSGSQSDHFEASIIDTRLRATEELLREQAAQR